MPSDGAPVRRLRAGVVGIGSHCRRNILPASRHVPLELLAFCDLDQVAAQRAAAAYGVPHVYGSLDQMLTVEDLDVVLLVAGPAEHPTLACEALRHGVHVWLEKPPGLSASDVVDIQKAQGDRVVVVGFKKAFMPATRKVVEVLAQPGVGPLRSMVGIYPLTIPEHGRWILAERRMNPWLNSCHPLAAMTAAGGPVAAVTTHRAALGGGVCVLEFASGAIGTLHLADGAAASQPVERYEFFGNNHHVTIENGLRVTFQRGVPFRYGETTTYAPPGLQHGAIVWEPQNNLATLENNPLFTQGIVASLDHFCTCIMERSPAQIGSTESALHLMNIYEAALVSAGDRVEIHSAAWA